MQRYFALNKNLELDKQDVFHITKVMRMKIDDKIEIVFDKKVYLCNIDLITNNSLNYSVQSVLDEDNELSKKVTIAFSLVNENKTDFIIQKCTELGAYDFIPVKAKRCKIKINDKEEKKINRWNTIAKEASEQSFRSIVPKINKIMDLKELINLDYDVKILCSTKEKEKTIKKILQNSKKCDRIIIVVGPEGGIDEEEESFLIENGFIGVTLGQTILRTETAPMFIMSALKYELMR